jgi:hypothetical protein
MLAASSTLPSRIPSMAAFSRRPILPALGAPASFPQCGDSGRRVLWLASKPEQDDRGEKSKYKLAGLLLPEGEEQRCRILCLGEPGLGGWEPPERANVAGHLCMCDDPNPRERRRTTQRAKAGVCGAGVR